MTEMRLEWVPVELMRIPPFSTVDHDRARSRAREIAADFDPEKLGALRVNLRDGFYWILDGVYRYFAVIQMGWGDQRLQCWTYHLTEAEEARAFIDVQTSK